jgi:putative ABC transport system substrate-binding protein
MAMRRRAFIAALGGAAAWPLVARAQQSAIPVIGFLYAGSEATPPLLAAFRKGLAETGHVEGRNVAVEYRWANNALVRLPELAADLVRRRVAVIATPGSYQAALAAKAASATIPIVFSTGVDPVRAGLVSTFNRPGGNVTGINYMQAELATKQLELLHELLPRATRFAVLVNPDNPVVTGSAIGELTEVASNIGVQIRFLRASNGGEIDAAFADISRERIEGLLVTPGPLFGNRRLQLTGLAAQNAVPTMFYDREFAEAGGLASYGSSLADQYRQTGIYTGRVLSGERPADLPVLRATKFELVINLKTARTLGLEIRPQVLASADEVIE